jgi:hypothetical protein
LSPPSLVLDYGRDRPTRWRRLLRWTVVALLLVALAFAGLFALRNLSIWVARRQGYAAVTAWYEQARTGVVPAGTLLYSERPADIGATRAVGTHADGSPHVFTTFEGAWPSLRQIGYAAHGVPNTFEYGILYAHEHDYWDVPAGSSPALLCVKYGRLDARGRPEFFTTAFRLAADPKAKVRIPSMGSSTMVQDVPARSLKNLRIFAGAPHPTDKRRFTLPFDCDGGRGRFEFRTDVDVSDGGQLAPDVWIEWDDAATTRAAP